MTGAPLRLRDLEAEVGVAELEAEIAVRRSQLAAGIIPDSARRSAFPWEVAARTNFAQVDRQQADTAGMVAERLARARAELLGLLEADLQATAEHPGPLPARVRVLLRLLGLNGQLGLQALAGSAQLADETAQDVRRLLAAGAGAGYLGLMREAAAQGVDVPAAPEVKLGEDAEWRLDLLAQRLATEPHTDVLSALVREAFTRPTTGPPDVTGLLDAGRVLSPNPLSTTARGAANSAVGMGRQSASATVRAPAAYYASELLDQNTCGPCSMVDGTDYDTLADAQADYPNGQYADCDGGDRCRGTLVVVWSTETPADA